MILGAVTSQKKRKGFTSAAGVAIAEQESLIAASSGNFLVGVVDCGLLREHAKSKQREHADGYIYLGDIEKIFTANN